MSAAKVMCFILTYGDLWSSLPCLQGMLVAITAVRLRAQNLCRQLGVNNPEEAIRRMCDERKKSQLVLLSYPRGVFMEGPSGP